MSNIGISLPIAAVVSQPVAQPLPAPAAGAYKVPTAGFPGAHGQDASQIPYDAQTVEAKQFAAVQQRSEDQGNLYVVSDREFTIFKDSSGQYITRYTSLRDGKITYVPAPELFKSFSAAEESTKPLVKIKA